MGSHSFPVNQNRGVLATYDDYTSVDLAKFQVEKGRLGAWIGASARSLFSEPILGGHF